MKKLKYNLPGEFREYNNIDNTKIQEFNYAIKKFKYENNDIKKITSNIQFSKSKPDKIFSQVVAGTIFLLFYEYECYNIVVEIEEGLSGKLNVNSITPRLMYDSDYYKKFNRYLPDIKKYFNKLLEKSISKLVLNSEDDFSKNYLCTYKFYDYTINISVIYNNFFESFYISSISSLKNNEIKYIDKIFDLFKRLINCSCFNDYNTDFIEDQKIDSINISSNEVNDLDIINKIKSSLNDIESSLSDIKPIYFIEEDENYKCTYINNKDSDFQLTVYINKNSCIINGLRV